MTKSGTDLRREALQEVESCVCRDRQNTYGDAENNFSDIADIANILLRRKLSEPLDARDVAAFCAAIKVARIATGPDHLDNWIDLAGYAVCGAGIVKRGAETKALNKDFEPPLEPMDPRARALFEKDAGLARAPAVDPELERKAMESARERGLVAPTFFGADAGSLRDNVIRHLAVPLVEPGGT